MAHLSPVDRLIAESERLRDELLKTATRLETFSEELMAEVRSLRVEAQDQLDTKDRLVVEGDEDVRGEGTQYGQGSD
jgi:hypothetical protein